MTLVIVRCSRSPDHEDVVGATAGKYDKGWPWPPRVDAIKQCSGHDIGLFDPSNEPGFRAKSRKTRQNASKNNSTDTIAENGYNLIEEIYTYG